MEIQYARQDDVPLSVPPLAVRASDIIFTGGQMAMHPTRGTPPEVKLLPGYPWHGSSVEKQLNYIYTNLEQTLQQLGSSLRHTLHINSVHIDPSEIYMALRVRKEWFGADDPPPSTLVLVPELPVHGPTVLLDTISLSTDSQLIRQPVVITKTPNIGHVKAFGWAGYLYAVRGGGFVFTAGKPAAGDQGPRIEAAAGADRRSGSPVGGGGSSGVPLAAIKAGERPGGPAERPWAIKSPIGGSLGGPTGVTIIGSGSP